MADKTRMKKNRASAIGGIARVTKIPALPTRPRDSHKGHFGKVLVIAGSREMLGAACLTTEAALRSGAGLVTLACPESIQLHAAARCICATTLPLPESVSGMIDPDKAIPLFQNRGVLDAGDRPTVIAAGPGIGQSDIAFARSWIELIRSFDRAARIPIVLDADGLNALAMACAPEDGFIDWPLSSNFVLTPHPGEMGRLCGVSTADIQADRERFVVTAARKLSERARIAFHDDTHAAATAPGVIVLKGAGTLVTDGTRLYTNSTGNPGMATGGSGDVLTGMIAGLIAQGMSRFDAAVLAVFAHGAAGDVFANAMGEAALTATELLDHIRYVLSEKQIRHFSKASKKPPAGKRRT